MSSQARLLNDQLKRNKISGQKLVAALASLPDGRSMATERRNVTRWRNGGGISPRNAERLVEAFRSLHVILPDDYFKRPQPAKTWQQQMEARMKSMQSEIRKLRKQVGA